LHAGQRIVLIIDDCLEDRAAYRRYLMAEPYYQILEAESGEEGFQHLQDCWQHPCDLILLDLRLPDMTGLEFLEQLNAQRINVPIIMLTAYGDEEIAVQAMKEGVQDYLIKRNLKPDVLQRSVRHVLRQSDLQQQLTKNQERQRLISAIALRIRQSLDLEQILNTAVAEARQLLQCDQVLLYQLIPDRQGKIVAESSPSSYWQAVEQQAVEQQSVERQLVEWQSGESNGDSANLGILRFEQSGNPLLEHLRDTTDLVVPITLAITQGLNPTVWGVLVAHRSTRQVWQADEADLLKELAVQLAIAIHQAELLSKTQRALAKEQELTAFKSQIISTVSHEYQSPLAAILAAASTLKTHPKTLSLAMKQRCLSIIEEKTRHLSALVQDMLSMNQSEQIGASCQPKPLDFGQFLATLIEEQKITASAHHHLSLQMRGDVSNFNGDPEVLRHIFVNLLSNAIKYSPQGGKITVQVQEQATQVMCRIADQGIGIPQADLRDLFQAFSRGSNVEMIPGTGLGLKIVQSCVKLHGGKVELESQLGKGTQVSIYLPKQVSGSSHNSRNCDSHGANSRPIQTLFPLPSSLYSVVARASSNLR
jgi:signal transduction histidine kinase/DNA-binding NarL/FixJ family response regulator